MTDYSELVRKMRTCIGYKKCFIKECRIGVHSSAPSRKGMVNLLNGNQLIQYIEDGLNRGEYGHDQIEVMTEVFFAPTIVPAERSEE